MRRWHNLLAPWLAAVLLVLAVTGLGIQVTRLTESNAHAAALSVRSPATCGPSQPKRSGGWNHWLKKVHSGEVAGAGGVVLSCLGGFGLLFFAASGLWMYVTVASRRIRARARARARQVA